MCGLTTVCVHSFRLNKRKVHFILYCWDSFAVCYSSLLATFFKNNKTLHIQELLAVTSTDIISQNISSGFKCPKPKWAKMIEYFTQKFHYQLQGGGGGAGADPCWHLASCGGSCWTSPLFITGLTHRDKHPFTLTFTPTGNLEGLINLNPKLRGITFIFFYFVSSFIITTPCMLASVDISATHRHNVNTVVSFHSLLILVKFIQCFKLKFRTFLSTSPL